MAIDIMKKSNITVTLALGLLIPFAALALTPEDEVTIRVMEMHENSTASVMDRIALPDAAIDKVAEEANDRKRLIEHKGDGEGAGENAGEGIGEMDQDLSYDLEQIQNQDQDREEMEQEQVQDQIRDSLGSEQPGKNPQRSGPEG